MTLLHYFLRTEGTRVLTCRSPSALGVCPQQCSLPAESVAASGSVCPVRQSHRTSSAGDLHARGHQGLHHLTAGVGPRHPQVRAPGPQGQEIFDQRCTRESLSHVHDFKLSVDYLLIFSADRSRLDLSPLFLALSHLTCCQLWLQTTHVDVGFMLKIKKAVCDWRSICPLRCCIPFSCFLVFAKPKLLRILSQNMQRRFNQDRLREK